MLTITKHMFLCLTLILFIPSESLSKTCCLREVATEVYAPYDTNSKVYKDIFGFSREFLNGAWDQVFIDRALGGGPKLECPTIWMIELNGAPEVEKFNEYFKIKRIEELDYMFYVKYNVTGMGEPPYGYEVKLEAELVDLAHGSTVKSAQSSWRCAPREAGECIRARIQNTENVAKSFQPLDKLIYDYERIPETLDIELEKNTTVPGEKMTITLKNIKDASSKPSKAWQRILVKVENGIILNGTETPLEGCKVFEVGSGNIVIEYLAPWECKNGFEKITVMNSCVINPKQNPIPEKEITRKQFDIICAEGLLSFSYLYQSPEIYKEATIEIGLGRLDFSLAYGVEGNVADYHPILFTKIRKAKALKDGLPGHGFRFFPGVEQASHHLIFTNPKSRKVVGVSIWNNLLMFNWSDGAYGYMIQGCAPNLSKPTEGDGIIRASSGCTRKTPDGIESFKWTLNRVGRSRK